jgi:D-amino-acid oxidase
MRRPLRIAVIGSGVVGLSAAHELSPVGSVTVFHDLQLLETTSALATAIWHVFLVDPDDQIHLAWAEITMRKLIDIHRDHTEAGIELIHGVQVYRTSLETIPRWSASAISFAMIPPAVMRGRYPQARFGYEVTTPAANMHKYLPWLAEACRRRGVNFIRRHIASFDVLDDFDWIVNCTGLRATDLTKDAQLFPVRGHYVVLEGGPNGPTEYFGDEEREDGMAYVIPRDGEVIVGGTAQDHETSLDFDIDARGMIERANQYCQGDILNLRIKRMVVGLRPCRASTRVRLERDADNAKVIHNYGHGGSGFSLAWGSAGAVLAIVSGADLGI